MHRTYTAGQRAKVILAKLLLEKPDVLLLDVPTNFLDKDHVAWLSEYLSALENAFMVVSHDHAFLDKAVNRICDIDHTSITKYGGTYHEFLRKKCFCGKIIYGSILHSKKKSKKWKNLYAKILQEGNLGWRGDGKSSLIGWIKWRPSILRK